MRGLGGNDGEKTAGRTQEAVFGLSVVQPQLYLLPSKYVLVEVELDLLIGQVDAELLKRVLLEVLKAEDIQDADVQALFVLSGGDENKKQRVPQPGYNSLPPRRTCLAWVFLQKNSYYIKVLVMHNPPKKYFLKMFQV